MKITSILAVSVFTMVGACLQTAVAYTTFESGQVRPLAMSAGGERLFAVNTPDSRLEIFDIADQGLVHRFSVPVGLDAVAVAVRNAGYLGFLKER